MLTLQSPAKVNLFLRVICKRSDGFHELASLFQTVTLADTLRIEIAEEDQLICAHPHVPLTSQNLIWQAIHLYRRKTGSTFKLHIYLDKQIPIEAGLGGGSSNAATALWAVNALAEHPVLESQLQEWAAEIGFGRSFLLLIRNSLLYGPRRASPFLACVATDANLDS